MIKSVRVVVTKSDRSAHKQLAFVHSQAETGQRGYMDAAFAAANQAAREQVIREATAQIKAQERRLRLFNDLIDQAEALGGVVGELESMAG